jgi:lipooligosaccharide transport system permease protein
MRVYTKNIISNGLPPFFEPLIFLGGIGLGLGNYIVSMDGQPYIQFLAIGLVITSAMYTAAFECSYGTFIRLEYDKAYDGMLAAPVTVSNLFVGEILWAGTKGLFFSSAVLMVMFAFRIVPVSWTLFMPVVGFMTGIMLGALSLLVTSFIKDINHLNFYFTGMISPMFFFSGVVFPVSSLPKGIQPLAELFPMTHSVRLVRVFSTLRFEPLLLMDLLYCIVVTAVAGYFAIKRLRVRLTN